MQSSADRGKLLDAYRRAGSSPLATIGGCGAALALFCSIAAGAVSADSGYASHDQSREEASDKLAVEQPSIAHARDVFAGRRSAHSQRNREWPVQHSLY
jgi:hypothetical protein